MIILENDVHSVQKVIDALRDRIKNASENNDYGTEHLLKGIIFEEMADRLEHSRKGEPRKKYYL